MPTPSTESNVLTEALEVLRRTLIQAFQGKSLVVGFSWPISDKAVSEIGGRLIEDFIRSHVEASINEFKGTNFLHVGVLENRGTADHQFAITFTSEEATIELQVAVKGHNQLRKRSRPSLASIRRCRELYSNPTKDAEVVILYCRYLPTIQPAGDRRELKLDILEESFSTKGLFLLRHLSERNLDPAVIGSGGQLLLARQSNIQLEPRTKEDFIRLLDEFSASLTKPSPRWRIPVNAPTG